MISIFKRNDASTRFLAVVLAVLMVFGYVPYATPAHAVANDIVITVVDGTTNEKVPGAKVTYSIESTAEGSAFINKEKEEATTDGDGKVTVLDFSQYEAGLKLSYTVECDKYQTKSNNVSELSEGQKITVELSRKNIDANVEGKTIPYDGSEQQLVNVTINDTDNANEDEIKYFIEKNNQYEETNGVPAEKNIGEYKVKVEISRKGYFTYEKEVTAHITQREMSGINVKLIENLVYDKGAQEIVEIIYSENCEPAKENVTVVYNGDKNEPPKYTNAGQYDVSVTVLCDAEDENGTIIYKNINFTDTAVISPDVIDGISIEGYSAEYDNEEHDAVIYSIESDNDDATTDTILFREKGTDEYKEEIPKIKDAGTKVIEYQIKRVTNVDGTEVVNHKIETGEITAAVNKADQKFISAEVYSASKPVVLDNNDDNKDKEIDCVASSETLPDNAMTYDVVLAGTEESAAKLVTLQDGKLKLAEGITSDLAGCIEVIATNDGDNNHSDGRLVGRVVVVAQGGIDLDSSNVSYTLNVNSDEVANRKADSTIAADNGKITYTLDKSDIGLEVDSEGVVSIYDISKVTKAVNDAGDEGLRVTVTASKAAGTENAWGKDNDIYTEAEASYDIIIKFAELPIGRVEVNGAANTDSAWFSGSELIVSYPGYSVLDSNTELGWTKDNFAGEMNLPVAGDENGVANVSLYLVNAENGDVTGIFKDTIRYDNIKPSMESVKFNIEKYSDDDSNRYYGIGDTVKVTLKASDTGSGVDKFVWSFVPDEDFSAANKYNGANYTNVDAKAGSDGEAVITLPSSLVIVDSDGDGKGDQLRGSIKATPFDKAGNDGITMDDKGNTIVVDTISPKVNIWFTGESTGIKVNANNEEVEKLDVGVREIYSGDINVKIEVKEANFNLDDITITVLKDEMELTDAYKDENWVINNETGVHTLSFDLTDDGDYQVILSYEDRANNVSEFETEYTSNIRTIDKTAPKFNVSFDPAAPAEGVEIVDGVEYYKDVRTATITVEERNFRNNLVIIKNLDGDTYSPEWKLIDGKWVAEVELSEQGLYQLSVSCKDIVGRDGVLENAAEGESANEYTSSKFYIDDSKPEITIVKYSQKSDKGYERVTTKILEALTFGYYKNSIKVVFEAKDNGSGVSKFIWSFTPNAEFAAATDPQFNQITGREVVAEKVDGIYRATIVLPDTIVEDGQLCGAISVYAVDYSGRESDAENADGSVIIVRDTITPEVTIAYSAGGEEIEPLDGKYYSNNDITATITVTEANFFKENVTVSVGGEAADLEWESDEANEVHTASFTIKANEGESIEKEIVAVVKDDADNYDENKSKHEAIVVVDKCAPKFSVSIDPAAPAKGTEIIDGVEYYQEERIATITVEEVNFDKELVTINGLDGITYSPEWKLIDGKWVAEIEFAEQGLYQLSVSCKDIVGRDGVLENAAEGESANEYTSSKFYIDLEDPTNARIIYSQNEEGYEITIKKENVLIEALARTFTFGYYKNNIKVVFEAKDNGSGISKFVWSYTPFDSFKAATASQTSPITDQKVPAKRVDGKYTAEITLPDTIVEDGQLCGAISVYAVDYAGRKTPTVNNDGGFIVVRDTITPEVTIAYSAGGEEIKPLDGKYYSNNDITATITVTEANFFAENVTVEIDGNKEILKWTLDYETGVHTASFTIEANEGESVEKKIVAVVNDDAGNYDESKSKHNATVVVDKCSPILSTFEAEAGSEANTHKVTFGITEINFNSENEFWMEVTAESNGVNGEVPDFKTILETAANWKISGSNDHVAVIENIPDGNYEITISYTDLAGNSFEKTKSFSFDETKPVVEDIEFNNGEDNAITRAFNNVTFNIFKKGKKVEATFIASDITSPITKFVWSYIPQDGAEDANVLSDPDAYKDIVINSDGIKTENRDGKTVYTADVILPFDDDQLRGCLKVFAYDSYGHQSAEFNSEETVVVDTVNSELRFEYRMSDSSDAVVKYYNGTSLSDLENFDRIYTNQNSTIRVYIKEANFFDGENSTVTLKTVNDAGEVTSATYKNLAWSKSGEEYYVDIELKDDGDHTVNVSYTDLSENLTEYNGEPGETFDSKTITIDRKAPVIDSVEFTFDKESKDKALTIQITEHNFDPSNVDITASGSAKDINDNDIADVLDYISEYFRGDVWTKAENSDTYTATMVLNDAKYDAVYDLVISYMDITGNESANGCKFKVDNTIPVVESIEYSEPKAVVIDGEAKDNVYKNGQMVDVTFTATDVTSGVESFTWTFMPGLEAANRFDNESYENIVISGSDIKEVKGEDGKIAYTATVTLPKNVADQLRGSFKVTAADFYRNISDEYTNATNSVIIDNIGPDVKVVYSSDDTDVKYYNNGDKCDSFENATNTYFNDAVNVTVSVKEANFYEGSTISGGDIVNTIKIIVEKTDDSGETTITSYIPKEMYTEAEGTAPITWADADDAKTFSIKFGSDADYVLKISGTDLSDNSINVTGSSDKGATGNGYESSVITVDTTAPVLNLKENVVSNGEIEDNQSVTFTVDEHNFWASKELVDIEVVVTATDINGNDVNAYDIGSFLKERINWIPKPDDENENSFTAELSDFSEDGVWFNGNYEIKVTYSDLAGNQIVNDLVFTIDHDKPEIIAIDYSNWSMVKKVISTLTFGIYGSEGVEVTFTAKDATTPVAVITWSFEPDENALFANDYTANYTDVVISGSDVKEVKDKDGVITGYTATVTLPAELLESLESRDQLRGSIKAKATDSRNNISDVHDDKANGEGIIVDTISPEISVEYSAESKETPIYYMNGELCDNSVEATDVYYQDTVTSKIVVNEANFFEGGENEDGKVIHAIGILVEKTDDDGNSTKTEYLPNGSAKMFSDAANTSSIEWIKEDGDTHYATITLAPGGDYVLKIIGSDLSENSVNVSASDIAEKKEDYVSDTIRVDAEVPTIKAEYSKDDQSITYTVDEHNFCEDDNIVNISVEASAVDITGKKNTSLPDIAGYLRDRSNWTQVEENGKLINRYTITVSDEVFAQEYDGIYDITVSYSDLSGKSCSVENEKLIFDKTAPTDLGISYEGDVIQKIIGTLTFGFYNPKTVKVTFTAHDMTAGVDYFTWKYTKQTGASTTNLSESSEFTVMAVQDETDKTKFTATVILPKEIAEDLNKQEVDVNLRGKITVTATDKHKSDKYNNTSSECSDSNIIVIDHIAPHVDIAYAYADGAEVRYVDETNEDADNFAKAERAYVNDDVTVTVTVNEANFFEGVEARDPQEVLHELGILVTKTVDTDNYTESQVTRTEYLPEGAAGLYSSDFTEVINWKNEGDIHTFSFTISEEADYVISSKYTDYSGNEAGIEYGPKDDKDYTSKIITIDKTAPTVAIEYANNGVLYNIDGRDYLSDNQNATITVREHNFKANEVEFTIDRKNVVGSDITCGKLNEQLRNLKDMSNWTKDGDTYTAYITFSEEANYTLDVEVKDLARNESADYAEDKFTVDRTAPKNLKVSYSTNFFETVMEHVTFGFYNAQMTVTISAEDDVAGIYRFMYSYVNNEGASSVNAELIDQAIKSAEITYDGKRANASFNIPKYVLKSDNQFNGTVNFTAFDTSENFTRMDDSRRVIVDNIRPTSTVNFNRPVQNQGGKAYYNGAINCTIVINEANFYSEDVKVMVSRGGSSYAAPVRWVDNSADVHTGTFTITGDGDYVVSMTYTDRSGNKMDDYRSGNMTIDTGVPVITLDSSIRNYSANNGKNNNGEDKNISFIVSVRDRNIGAGSFRVVLNAVIKEDNGNNVYTYRTVSIPLGNPRVSNVGGDTVVQYVVNNLDRDGYYSLSCTASDYSGHTTSTINYVGSDGRTGSSARASFSVNREGSTFWLETQYNDKYSADSEKMLINDLEGKFVNDQVYLEIHELNVDRVDTFKDDDFRTVLIINDGSGAEQIVLTEKENGVGNYDKNIMRNNGAGWYESVYTLDNSYFERDGDYSISIFSYDMASNRNVNTQKNQGVINFTVDRTAPVIMSNVETGQRIFQKEFPVVIKITDLNLNVDEIKIMVNGDPVTAEEVGFGEYKVVIGGGKEFDFAIDVTAKDLAGNSAVEYHVDKVIVTENKLIYWLANNPLAWALIAGAGGLSAGSIFFIILKKKKKKEEEES